MATNLCSFETLLTGTNSLSFYLFVLKHPISTSGFPFVVTSQQHFQRNMPVIRTKTHRSERTLAAPTHRPTRAKRAERRAITKERQDEAEGKAQATLEEARRKKLFQSSKLLNLPAELRNQIYDLVLDQATSRLATTVDIEPLQLPAITKVCKLLRQEILPIFAAGPQGKNWEFDFDLVNIHAHLTAQRVPELHGCGQHWRNRAPGLTNQTRPPKTYQKLRGRLKGKPGHYMSHSLQ